ncbi:S41 family peptidase [Neoasaia chiangmaiensis]|nr:S41 family peptidase [Neoasaia chiangmaiensis]
MSHRSFPRSMAGYAARVLLLLGTLGAVAAAPVDPVATPETATSSPLNIGMLSNVLSSALNFLQPRTLESYSARDLCWWGLDGLTAIDPAIVIEEVPPPDPQTRKPPAIQLMSGQRVLRTFPRPGDTDTAGWIALVVSAMQEAWTQSTTIRAAGSTALLQSFFDELFNHLDPYSRYVGPAPAVQDRTARFGGAADVGVTLGRDDRGLFISAVNANGPAWTAGVNVGQRLLAVDSRSTRNQSPESVAHWLSGPSDSRVLLTLADPGRRRANLVLHRASVPPQTVFAYTHGHLVVLRVTSFSTETAEELSQYIDQSMQDTKLAGIILDLRGDRGGVLQQAVTATALVLDHGVAVVTNGRDQRANHIWAVQGGDMTKGVPIVVMVDGRTASAAEIMAAALADHRRAVVIGSATLGKGLVQAIGQMPDGGELFVTWSRVLAPLGWPLQGLGVIPQICTARGEADLQHSLRALRDGQVVDAPTVRASRAARYPLSVSRILDIRRNCPAAIGTDADLDAAQAILTTPGAYKTALSAIPDDLSAVP